MQVPGAVDLAGLIVKPSASKRYMPVPLNDPFVSSLAFDPVSHLLWIGTMNNVYVYIR